MKEKEKTFKNRLKKKRIRFNENNWQLIDDKVRGDGDSDFSSGSQHVLCELSGENSRDQLGGKLENGMAPVELKMTVFTNQLEKSLNQKRD